MNNMKKYLSLIFAASMFSCAEVVDHSGEGTGGEIGGAGGTTQTSSETTSSAGTGGVETTSSTETFTDTPTATTTQTITDTKTKQCQAGTYLCMEACCDKEVNPTMCASNENGYCCPIDFFCIPKG